jgi:hypothetical protein
MLFDSSAQNSYNSKIKDHWSQITITDIIIVKKFEISRELPKCDTETRSEHLLLENGANRLAWRRVATNLRFVKIAISAKRNKTRCTCIRSGTNNVRNSSPWYLYVRQQTQILELRWPSISVTTGRAIAQVVTRLSLPAEMWDLCWTKWQKAGVSPANYHSTNARHGLVYW